ncbi:DUF4263 domain-containing protein [Rhodoferax sp.]|uniref:Shedu immune nuclease family protein n=1 Tax=Rhodoferax sp. TaxID=50421 RepID=UPI0028436E49|nr:DUF4263 domain-containing protein [Rhodoferax sp.]MDR3369533.1 DUF4263 domain-containing protein [Rhodoferax sp.]
MDDQATSSTVNSSTQAHSWVEIRKPFRLIPHWTRLDLGDMNPGQSITNSIERVNATLLSRGTVLPGAQLIEHYEDINHGQPTFDLVTFSESGSPNWQSISLQQAAQMLDCDVVELSTVTLSIPRLAEEADRMRTAIDPFAGSPWLEAPEVVNRRARIAANMVSKAAIQELVERGASERELLSLLKRDLSLFGELYASPHEHYLAFSEFPLADGFVDFTLFTSTSRMEIVLIEVKGADFFLVNDDHYGEVAQSMNRAAGQIRRRIGDIYENLPMFRKRVHEIRARAEAGEKIHGAFLSPYCPIGVDPNKDITIRTVVIGGRTRDDLVESKKRHQFEHGVSPPIKIESWDTWLRKLRRQ